MRIFRRTRRPRPADPELYTRLDRLDGLPGRTRYDAEWSDVVAAEVAPAHQYPAPDWLDDEYGWEVPRATLRAERSALDVGGDLAAMAAPLDPYLGLDWCGSAACTGTAPGDWGEYDIVPWPGHLAARVVDADAEVDLPMVRAAATAYDLGLPVPLRSDPPIYRACLAGHTGMDVTHA